MTTDIRHIVFFIFVLFILSACEKEEVGPVSTTDPQDSTTTSQDTAWQGVFICNEGNFQWGNGSLSFYKPDSQTVQQKVFQSINNSKLGDVVQSMTIIDNKGYIVVNNSGKIEVVNMETMEQIATISDLESPRYMCRVSANKAYVSDLYAGKLAIVDLSSNTVTGHISLSGWTEDMIEIDQSVYVTNMDSSAVYEVETATDKVVDTIDVGVEPNSIITSSNGNIWVLCSGGVPSKEKPSVYQIDPANNNVMAQLTFPDKQSSPDNLVIDRSAGTMYYLDGGLYRMDVAAGSLPEQALVAAGDRTFYGLGVHPQTGELYVTDAKNYTENGDIYRFAQSGSLVDSFSAGRIPGYVAFHTP